MELKTKRTFAIFATLLSYGMLAGTVAEFMGLADLSFEVGTIMLINYTTVAIFSSVYLGFLSCKIDLLNSAEHPAWTYVYGFIAVLLIPSSILQLVLVAMLFVKEGASLSKLTLFFCWFSVAIGMVYSLGMIGYTFGNKIRKTLKKRREVEDEKRYKIGVQKLTSQIEERVYDYGLFIQVFKPRRTKEHPIEKLELEFLKKRFERPIITNINGNMINGEPCCPICQNEWDLEKTFFQLPVCNHCFDQECLEHWFTQSVVCPICKQSVRAHLVQALEDNLAQLSPSSTFVLHQHHHSGLEEARDQVPDAPIPITI